MSYGSASYNDINYNNNSYNRTIYNNTYNNNEQNVDEFCPPFSEVQHKNAKPLNLNKGTHILKEPATGAKMVHCSPQQRFFGFFSQPLKQCVAEVIVPAGATIVKPSNDDNQMRTNGFFVRKITCKNEFDDFVEIMRFDKCYSNYDPKYEYKVGEFHSETLNINHDKLDESGLHLFPTKENALDYNPFYTFSQYGK
jgi:hypothetical protein